MAETRKLAAILAADIAGYSKLAGSDEERTLARLRALRSDLIDPTIAVHHGRVVKRTGDGSLVEFRSVVDAVRCAIEIQNGMVERNAGLPPERRIEFRVGIHLGDVVEESDGDLMGDGVNIAARLEGIAKPGAICLSEDAYRQVQSRLDLAVSDLGATQLKNIAQPVRVYSLEVGQPAKATKPPAPKQRLLIVLLGAAIVALIAIAGSASYFLGASRPATVTSNAPATRAEAAHLSIVVLPFTNLSGDPSQDYFADGITENLTTDLSRIRNSFVIGRNTAFTFKGKNIDSKEISKELGVRYVLEGSVQRDQTHVRVNAQLIDGETGAHLWADRFEEDLANVFKLQDQVVARLANTLGYELVKAEAQRGAHSTNPDAIDLTMRGLAMLSSAPTMDQNHAARALLEQALNIDPDDARALTGNSITYLWEYIFFKNSETDYDSKILGQADRAIALDRNYMSPYIAKGAYLNISGRPAEAVRVADAGLAIDPNAARLYATRGIAEVYLSKFDQGKTDVQQAMRLSPRDPELSMWHNFLANAERGLGHLDTAIDETKKAIAGGYGTFYAYLDLAVALALKGDIDDAKVALVEARRLNPGLSVKWLRERKPVLESAFDGLRKAGLPEE
jgi:adenylate cyclase